MKILVIVGACRKNGNIDQLADAFIRGAEETGHTVIKAFLGDKTIKYSMGCNACMKFGQCVHKDDINALYVDYLDCDMSVLASPLYYWMILGLLKTVIDRLYGVEHMKYKKQSALLMTAR